MSSVINIFILKMGRQVVLLLEQIEFSLNFRNMG